MNALHAKASKGEETRAKILEAALRQASLSGFEAITIGELAATTGLSKSGLFAHFGSKEELQIATLDEALRRFNEAVVLPALSLPRGLKRLSAVLENSLTWTERCGLKGCPLMTAMQEFDDKPGAIRNALVEHELRIHESLVKSIRMAVELGELSADTDAEQFAFEIFGVIASCSRSFKLLDDNQARDRARRAFKRLIQSYQKLPCAEKAAANPLQST